MLIVLVARGGNASPSENLLTAKGNLQSFEEGLGRSSRIKFYRTPSKMKGSLTTSERKDYEEYQRLKKEVTFWERGVRLQEDLLQLGGPEKEAGMIAEKALRSVDELAERYHLVRPALFQNLLINVGIKERGFCYHWAGDLMRRLMTLKLAGYQLHWGVAHDGGIREHNSVVVTLAGAPFEEGLVLDGWRHSGDLYWVRVKKDHYPWRELPLETVPLDSFLSSSTDFSKVPLDAGPNPL